MSNEGALKWYQGTVPQLEKDKIEFEGFVHELHKEPGSQRVFKQVLLYISKRM